MPEKIKMNGMVPEGAVICPDPRFTYMDPEEVAALGARIMPGELHVEHVKRQYRDIQFGPLPEQLLDIYLPESGEGPFPAILYVHGGGWSIGTRASGSIDFAIDGVNRGYAVVGIDYRLLPDGRFPENVYDVKAAVRWLRAHAEEYHLDPDRFGMMGDSAGGHLTLMCAMTGDRPEYEGGYGNSEQSTRLQACISLYGPSDMLADDEMFLESGKVRMSPPSKPSLYDVLFGADIDNLLYLVSPMNMVHKDIPPILFQHGEDDPLVPYQQSTRLYEKVVAVCGGDHAELDLIPGYTHSDPRFLDGKWMERRFAFFDKYLK